MNENFSERKQQAAGTASMRMACSVQANKKFIHKTDIPAPAESTRKLLNVLEGVNAVVAAAATDVALAGVAMRPAAAAEAGHFQLHLLTRRCPSVITAADADSSACCYCLLLLTCQS